MIISVRTADSVNPPITTDPKPLYNSAPAPGKRTSGIMPKTLVRVDMKIGLILFRVASIMASVSLKPSDRN